MAKCIPNCKYDLGAKTWIEGRSDAHKAFSSVRYNSEFGQKKEDRSGFEYFIVVSGMRRENYSKTRTIRK